MADPDNAQFDEEASAAHFYQEAGDAAGAGYRDVGDGAGVESGAAGGGAAPRRPYLGGFRDTRTGAVYHHAYTETDEGRRIRPHKWEGVLPGSRIEREAQTSSAVTRGQQSLREGAAQTARRDLHHDAGRDVVLVARPYVTADEVMEVRHAQAVRIQCAMRSHLARKRFAELAEERDEYRASLDRAAIEAARAEAARAVTDAARRAEPRSPGDFAVLYDEIEAWRLGELARIDGEAEAARAVINASPLPPMGSINGPEAADRRALQLADIDRQRRSALVTLLRREQVLVSRLEVAKVKAGRLNAASRAEGQLAAMAAPKTWACSDGETVAVTTPAATRAAQLKALADALGAAGPQGVPDRGARADLLAHVKYTVREFDTALTREIAALADREVDLMARRRPAAAFAGLRPRLRNLFLAFCATPAFNPAAAAFAKLPGGPLAPLAGSISLADLTGHTGGAAGSGARPLPAWAPTEGEKEWEGEDRHHNPSHSGGGGGGGGGPSVQHPFAGTRRDPRLLAIPSFMRPTLRKA